MIRFVVFMNTLVAAAAACGVMLAVRPHQDIELIGVAVYATAWWTLGSLTILISGAADKIAEAIKSTSQTAKEER